MSLAYQLENLDDLDESLKSLYVEKDGVFVLNVSGVPTEDVSGLKASHEKLLAEKKEQQRKAQEAEAERNRIAEESARKNNDFEAMDKSWAEKYALLEDSKTSEVGKYKALVHGLTVGEQATRLASKIGSPNSQRILAKEIKSRLTLGDDGSVRVLDSQGQPSALTIDELEKELMTNPEYSDMIVGSQATGGGATGGFGGGATKKPNEYSEQERVDLLNKNPALFNQLFGKK